MALSDLVTDWGGFERLIETLHDTGEVQVERNVILTGRSGAPRQIDVLIRHKQGLYEHLIVAECKYWNSAVERQDVDALVNTVREVGAKGVLFSTKGFRSGAIKQAKHDGIELYRVRDLSDEEWGLPGRVVDLFLQIAQIGLGNVAMPGAYAMGPVQGLPQVSVNLHFGEDGVESTTPTLRRDGTPGGQSLEKYILDAAQKSFAQALENVEMFNSGAEGTYYVGAPTNLVPDIPIKILTEGNVVHIPKISFDVGVKIDQSRITIDRAKYYQFALAVQSFVTGKVSSASRAVDDKHTTLRELPKRDEHKNLDGVVKNHSLIRVVIKGFFPFEEMAGLTPVPIDSVRKPFSPTPLPPADQSPAKS